MNGSYVMSDLPQENDCMYNTYACVVVFCVFLNRGFASTRCVFGRFVCRVRGVVRFSTKREADAERKIHNLRPITHDE